MEKVVKFKEYDTLKDTYIKKLSKLGYEMKDLSLMTIKQLGDLLRKEKLKKLTK